MNFESITRSSTAYDSYLLSKNTAFSERRNSVLQKILASAPVDETKLRTLFELLADDAELQAIEERLVLIQLYQKTVTSTQLEAFVHGTIQIAVFTDCHFLFTETPEKLMRWQTAIAHTSSELPNCPLKRDLEELTARMYRSDLYRTRTPDPHRQFSELCASKAKAYQSAQNLIRHAAEIRKANNEIMVIEQYDSPEEVQLAKTRSLLLPPIAAAKLRHGRRGEAEALVEQLMGLSLSQNVVASWQIPESKKHRVCRVLFPENELSTLVATPYERFLDVAYTSAHKEYILEHLNEESTLALAFMLEFQPMDHHSGNMGFRLCKKEPLSAYSEYTCTQHLPDGSQRTYFRIEELLLAYLKGNVDPNGEITLKNDTIKKRVKVSELISSQQHANSIKWEVLFFDNEYMMFDANNTLYYRINTPDTNDPYTIAHPPLHLVPIHSFLMTSSWAKKPLGNNLLKKMLDPERERQILAWLNGGPTKGDLRSKARLLMQSQEERIAELQQKYFNLESSPKELADILAVNTKLAIWSEIDAFVKNRNKDFAFSPRDEDEQRKEVLLSLLPKCTLRSIAALQERWQSRREYVAQCERFKTCKLEDSTKAVLSSILSSPSPQIPSTVKTRLRAECSVTKDNDKISIKKIHKELHQWMIPSYQSLACAMYPLLADTLFLLDTINCSGSVNIGSYETPLEAIIYRYLKMYATDHEIIARLQIAKDAMMTSNPKIHPMKHLQGTYLLMYSRGTTPRSLEVEHIMHTALNCHPGFYVDTSGKIDDPDDMN